MLDKRAKIDEKQLFELTDPKSGQNYCVEIKTLLDFIISSIPKPQGKKSKKETVI